MHGRLSISALTKSFIELINTILFFGKLCFHSDVEAIAKTKVVHVNLEGSFVFIKGIFSKSNTKTHIFALAMQYM